MLHYLLLLVAVLTSTECACPNIKFSKVGCFDSTLRTTLKMEFVMEMMKKPSDVTVEAFICQCAEIAIFSGKPVLGIQKEKWVKCVVGADYPQLLAAKNKVTGKSSKCMKADETSLCDSGYQGKCIGNDTAIFAYGIEAWASWSVCSKPCGPGTHKRSKYVPAKVDETGTCEEVACDVNGGYSAWSQWACNVKCGSGTQTRSRTCTNPAPAGDGKTCTGAAQESKACVKACGVDGGYSTWGQWSACDKTCGTGQQRQTRTCTNPAPVAPGKTCSLLGPASRSKSCTLRSCPCIDKSFCQRYKDKVRRNRWFGKVMKAAYCLITNVRHDCKKWCGKC